MEKIKSFILCLLFPVVLYGKESPRDTVTIHADKQVYELISSVEGAGTAFPVFRIRLMKGKETVDEQGFPLTGRCPIEEDISVEASGKGFIVRIPYCDGYLFHSGEARFVYSKEQDDFILTAYEEEIIDRQHPERESRNIKYDLPENRVTLSGFSPCAITNKADTLYYKNDTISQELVIR